MLDYAANAVLYWPVVRIRDIYENSNKTLLMIWEKLFKSPTFHWEKLMTEKAQEKFRTILEGHIAKV